MPANKRRSRNGNGNSSSSSSSSAAAAAAAAVQHNLKSSVNPITKIFNNLNGFANGSSYNGYHHSAIGNHQVNNNHSGSVAAAAAATVVSTANGAITTAPSTFTAKQQQQLDRNAFLLTLTKDQLKVECRKRGQKTTGTKTELVHLIFSLCFIVVVVVFLFFSSFVNIVTVRLTCFSFVVIFIRCFAPPSINRTIIFN